MTKRLASDEYRRKLINDFELAKNQEPEVQALMVKFLCIRISGYIETFIKERIQNFVNDRKSHKVISSYIQTAIRNITNLTNDKLESFLRSFSSDWANYYMDNVTEQMKSSLGSIYILRNHIAHGANDSLSYNNLRDHFENIERLLEVIDQSITK